MWNDEADGNHVLLGQAETSVAAIVASAVAEPAGRSSPTKGERGRAHFLMQTEPGVAKTAKPKRTKAGVRSRGPRRPRSRCLSVCGNSLPVVV